MDIQQQFVLEMNPGVNKSSRPIYSSGIKLLSATKDIAKRKRIALLEIMRTEFRACFVRVLDANKGTTIQKKIEDLDETDVFLMLADMEELLDNLLEQQDPSQDIAGNEIISISFLEEATRNVRGYVVLYFRSRMLKIIPIRQDQA